MRHAPPGEKFDKNGAIWCNVGVPKYVITNRKTNNFKVTKSATTKHNRHMFHSDQLPYKEYSYVYNELL